MHTDKSTTVPDGINEAVPAPPSLDDIKKAATAHAADLTQRILELRNRREEINGLIRTYVPQLEEANRVLAALTPKKRRTTPSE